MLEADKMGVAGDLSNFDKSLIFKMKVIARAALKLQLMSPVRGDRDKSKVLQRRRKEKLLGLWAAKPVLFEQIKVTAHQTVDAVHNILNKNTLKPTVHQSLYYCLWDSKDAFYV